MTNQIASHALSLAVASEGGQVPDWAQIFPAGPEISARDGRHFTLHDPQAVIAASTTSSVEILVDVEHASETRPQKGLEAPAFGWVKELQIRAGAIWGRIEWTAKAREWIATKAYRYLSPTFYHDESGEILGLKSVALVNSPAFEMTALARAENPQIQMEKNTMDKTVLDALGLAATASAAEAVAAIAALKGDVQTATARAENPDPTKFVAKAQYDATAAKLAEATAALEAQEAAKFEAAVDAGVEAGKIMPAARDNYLAMARSIGLEAFGQQLNAMPKIVGEADPKDATATAQAGLNAEDRLVASAFDMSETDFAQAKK